MEGELSIGSCEGQGVDLSGPSSKSPETYGPRSLAVSLAQSMVLDRSWRKGEESLDEGARREAALGRACIPGFCWRKRCVSVSCVLWGRHFPRGGLLKGKTSTGEEVKTDRAFLGATGGDIGLLWSICDGDVLVMVDGGGAILEHPGIKHFSWPSDFKARLHQCWSCQLLCSLHLLSFLCFLAPDLNGSKFKADKLGVGKEEELEAVNRNERDCDGPFPWPWSVGSKQDWRRTEGII